jgi:hypothetical protein
VAVGADFCICCLGQESTSLCRGVTSPSLTDSPGRSGPGPLAAENLRGGMSVPVCCCKSAVWQCALQTRSDYADSGIASWAFASSPQCPCCGDPQQLARGGEGGRPANAHPS